MKKFFLLTTLVIFFAVGICSNLYGSDLDDGRLAEIDGETDRAIRLYTKWLNSHQTHPAFVNTLYRTALLINDLDKGIKFLQSYHNKIKNVTEKKEYLVRLGGLQEIVGDLKNASRNYLLAATLSDDVLDYHFLLKHYRIQWSMGDPPSFDEVEKMRARVDDYSLFQAYTILEAQILYSKKEYFRGVTLLGLLKKRDGFFENPLRLYMVALGASYYNPALTKDSEEILLKRFPKSVEALLIKDNASEIFSPETFTTP